MTAAAEGGGDAPAVAKDDSTAATTDAKADAGADTEADADTATDAEREHPLLDAALGEDAPPKTYAKGEHPGLDTALSMGRTGSNGKKKKKDRSAEFSAETGFRIMRQDPNAFVTGFDVYAEEEIAKRKAREAKFGKVVPDAVKDEDDPRGDYDDRKARAAKFGVPVCTHCARLPAPRLPRQPRACRTPRAAPATPAASRRPPPPPSAAPAWPRAAAPASPAAPCP